jgi:hypothetical protein
MPSNADETQLIIATHVLEEFVKILVNEYPLVFKNCTGSIKTNLSFQQQSSPYEASLTIKKKKSSKNSSKVSSTREKR